MTGPAPDGFEPALTPGTSALLVIDMQYLDADPSHGLGAAHKAKQTFATVEYYFDQVSKIIPRIRALQDCCRAHGLAVIHTRLRSATVDGRDRSPMHRRKGWEYPPGSKEVEFLPEVAPRADELVIDKTSSGAFNSTAIDQVLRNLGVENLIVCGVELRYCVETTVRDAADRGYCVYLVRDGCASKSKEMEEAGFTVLDNEYCVVRTAEEVIANIERAATASAGSQVRA